MKRVQTKDLDVTRVAGELSISRNTVTSMIETGQLDGYNAAAKGAEKRSYRVTRESLNRFKQERKVCKVEPAESVAS